MEAFFYILIFIMGTIFGSFLTLATYRIPLHQDILYKHSYCTKCNHKLGFLDMIPVFSYIFLGGKCRYCKEKIKIRYPLIEILCGIAFIILSLGIGLNLHNLYSYKGIEFTLGVLFIVFLFLIAGIDLEHGKVDKGVLIYGILISLLNIIYQYFTMENFNISRIVFYLCIISILTILSTYRLKKKAKGDYEISIIILCIIINFFTLEIGTILSIILALLILTIKLILNKILNKGKKYNKISLAAYVCISNAIVWISIFLNQMGG